MDTERQKIQEQFSNLIGDYFLSIKDKDLGFEDICIGLYEATNKKYIEFFKPYRELKVQRDKCSSYDFLLFSKEEMKKNSRKILEHMKDIFSQNPDIFFRDIGTATPPSHIFCLHIQNILNRLTDKDEQGNIFFIEEQDGNLADDLIEKTFNDYFTFYSLNRLFS